MQPESPLVPHKWQPPPLSGRASNELLRGLKFYNHREGSLEALSLTSGSRHPYRVIIKTVGWRADVE